MQGLAIYGIVIFGLMTVFCTANIVLSLGYEVGNSIVGLVVAIPALIFCFSFVWKKTKQRMRFLATYNIAVFGLLAISGISNIIFNRDYEIWISITGLLITVIPMLIFCHRYLWNEAKKEAKSKVPLITLQRSFEGIQLGETAVVFENNSVWKEMVGSEKAMFESGLLGKSGERLFTMSSGGKMFVCGFVFDMLYKVGIIISASDIDLYLKRFTDKYGQPIKFKRGCYEWQDEKTVLNLMMVGSQRNIILTDRNLLKKAYGMQ